MNNITICGNATEPELKYTSTGKAVVSLSIAVNRKRGEETETTWFRVEAWEQMAENIAGTVCKGDRVIVTGRIKTDEYTNKDGDKRTSQVVVADECGVSLRWSPRDHA